MVTSMQQLLYAVLYSWFNGGSRIVIDATVPNKTTYMLFILLCLIKTLQIR